MKGNLRTSRMQATANSRARSAACAPGMGADLEVRVLRRPGLRDPSEALGLHREVGSEGSPIQMRGATCLPPACRRTGQAGEQDPGVRRGWHTRDERARDREIFYPQRGVLHKSSEPCIRDQYVW